MDNDALLLVRLPAQLKADIYAYARGNERSISQEVRLAIKVALAKPVQPEAPTR